MNCSNYSQVDDLEDLPGIYRLKVAVLTVQLLVCVFGNGFYLVKWYRQDAVNWRAADWLLAGLTGCGLANGLVNITPFLATLVSGGWLLGNVCCQMFGPLSAVLEASWFWILTIALFERYKFLLAASDYSALFSVLNTRILVWGSCLLLVVLYLSPNYGWGEYTYLKGSFPVLLSFKNATVPPETQGVVLQEAAQTSLTAYIRGNESDETVAMERLRRVLAPDGHIHLRKYSFSADGVLLSLTARSGRAMGCFWDAYVSRVLEDSLATSFLKESSKVGGLTISVSIDEELYSTYRDAYLAYQSSSTCGLDFSPVNPNVLSFAVFSWSLVLLLPFVCCCYCFIRVFCWPTSSLYAYSDDYAQSNDVACTQVLVYATLYSFLSTLPRVSVHLAIALGRADVPSSAVFASTASSFSSWVILPVLQFAMVDSGLCAGPTSSCLYRCWLCLPFNKNRQDIEDSLYRRRKARRQNPSIRTLLLSRTTSSSSGYRSDRHADNRSEETFL